MTSHLAGRAAAAAVLAALIASPAGAAAATPSTALSAKLGMRIDGHLWRQHAGDFVARAGDVNGDGLADLLVGTQETHVSGPGRNPRWNLYVVFGCRRAGGVLSLDRLGSRGLRITTGASFGFESGAGAGDVNRDGRDDIVVGRGEREGSTGAAFVIFGRRSGGTIDVGRLGSGGFAVTAGGNAESLGRAVAGAGDLDRDGYADVILGEPDYVPPGAQRGGGPGRVVVVFGSRSSARVDARRSGSRVTQIIGPGPFPAGPTMYGASLGGALAGAGDTNGDHRRDLLIGASSLGGGLGLPSPGAAFVVLNAGRRAATIDMREPQNGWYRIAGLGARRVGYAVAGAGDQNGDGLADLLIGTHSGGDLLFASKGPSDAYVVYGRARPTDVALDALGDRGAILHDATSGDRAGVAVAGAGDVTRDGRPDLLVGAPLAERGAISAAGSAFLVPGGRLAATVNLRALPGRGARRYDGTKAYDTAGWAVAGLGDFNGDRHSDIAVAAPRADPGSRQSAGSVFVVFG